MLPPGIPIFLDQAHTVLPNPTASDVTWPPREFPIPSTSGGQLSVLKGTPYGAHAPRRPRISFVHSCDPNLIVIIKQTRDHDVHEQRYRKLTKLLSPWALSLAIQLQRSLGQPTYSTVPLCLGITVSAIIEQHLALIIGYEMSNKVVVERNYVQEEKKTE